jgi:hypothetical protein
MAESQALSNGAGSPLPAAARPGSAQGAYEPGWSPEEMRGDMRALEAAAEGVIMALRGREDALGELISVPVLHEVGQ